MPEVRSPKSEVRGRKSVFCPLNFSSLLYEMTDTRKTGKVVIVSGPSGVGKSTICKEVVKRLGNAYISVSVTTRGRAEGEVDGQDYWFVSDQQFQERIDRGLLLEYAKVFGSLYGTPKDKVDEHLRVGEVVILEIDVQGAEQAKLVYPDAVMVFILPPSAKTLAERMGNRAREDAETVQARLNGAEREIAAAWEHYDNMVINDDLEQAVGEVVQIIEAR